jgi:hypothetical protein
MNYYISCLKKAQWRGIYFINLTVFDFADPFTLKSIVSQCHSTDKTAEIVLRKENPFISLVEKKEVLSIYRKQSHSDVSKGLKR